jgi:hypothetical protein
VAVTVAQAEPAASTYAVMPLTQFITLLRNQRNPS